MCWHNTQTGKYSCEVGRSHYAIQKDSDNITLLLTMSCRSCCNWFTRLSCPFFSQMLYNITQALRTEWVFYGKLGRSTDKHLHLVLSLPNAHSTTFLADASPLSNSVHLLSPWPPNGCINHVASATTSGGIGTPHIVTVGLPGTQTHQRPQLHTELSSWTHMCHDLYHSNLPRHR